MVERIQLLPNVWLRAVRSNKFKTGCFSINFIRPLSRREAAINGLIPSVLLWATERYPSITAISNRLDDLYGATVGSLVRKKGEVQTLGFYADFLEDQFVEEPEGIFVQMVEFVSELLFHPLLEGNGFCADGFENERRNLINAIESRKDDKRTYAVHRMLSAMCGEEAYSVPRLGEAEDLDGVTAGSLYAHYRHVLATSPVEIFYMGRKSAQEAAELFRKALQPLPRGEMIGGQTAVVRRAQTVRRISEPMDVTQGKLCIGLRTDCSVADGDFPALQLLNVIFGGSASSKLFLNVREKNSLCYYASSSIEKYKGLMIVSSGVDFANFATAEQAILNELEACRAGEISEEEMFAAKQALYSSFKAIQDSPGGLDDYYMGMALTDAVMDFDSLRAAIERLTVEDVARAARKLTVDTIYELTGVNL